MNLCEHEFEHTTKRGTQVIGAYGVGESGYIVAFRSANIEEFHERLVLCFRAVCSYPVINEEYCVHLEGSVAKRRHDLFPIIPKRILQDELAELRLVAAEKAAELIKMLEPSAVIEVSGNYKKAVGILQDRKEALDAADYGIAGLRPDDWLEMKQEVSHFIDLLHSASNSHAAEVLAVNILEALGEETHDTKSFLN